MHSEQVNIVRIEDCLQQLRPKSSEAEKAQAEKHGRGGLLEIQILPKTKIRPAFAGFWAKGQTHNRLLRPLQSCQVDDNLWQLCTEAEDDMNLQARSK